MYLFFLNTATVLSRVAVFSYISTSDAHPHGHRVLSICLRLPRVTVVRTTGTERSLVDGHLSRSVFQDDGERCYSGPAGTRLLVLSACPTPPHLPPLFLDSSSQTHPDFPTLSLCSGCALCLE